jgi:hypothetical protein
MDDSVFNGVCTLFFAVEVGLYSVVRRGALL